MSASTSNPRLHLSSSTGIYTHTEELTNAIGDRLRRVQETTRRVERAADNITDIDLSIHDKESMIIALQEEVLRLKTKLTSIINSAEQTITDAQFVQDDIEKKFTSEIELLRSTNESLLVENQSLRDMLQQSNSSLHSGLSYVCSYIYFPHIFMLII